MPSRASLVLIDQKAKIRENIQCMVQNSAERGPSPETPNKLAITVAQPEKLGNLLETIDLLNSVSERMGEDRNGDMGAGGSGSQTGNVGMSARDQAIANLPDTPVMQLQLQGHIEKEVKQLRHEIRMAAKRAGKPGNAYQLNKLYARIRRLNGILKELFSASLDTVKRLYIRVFVDKQTAF